MARRKLRRIQPRRTRPQKLERRPSEMHHIKTLAAIIRGAVAELAAAGRTSKHRRPSLLPTSRRIKTRQLLLVYPTDTGGPLLRKAAEGGDGTVTLENFDGEFRWAIVYRPDNLTPVYFMDLGEVDFIGTVVVSLFPPDDQPRGQSTTSTSSSRRCSDADPLGHLVVTSRIA